LWNLRLVHLEYCSWLSTLISSSEILFKRQQITTNEQQEVIDGHSKQLIEQSDKITELEQKVLDQRRSKMLKSMLYLIRFQN
jgi:hypothetical protein